MVHMHAMNIRQQFVPKFAKMQKMFQGKISSTSNGKVVANVKIVIADMNLIVNVATKRKITEKQVLQENEQNNYELGGGEILKDNGRHHTLIAEGTYYK